MAWVYILKSDRDGRFYIGSTTNLPQRLKHHYGGSTYSTARMGQLRLILKQEYPTLKEARQIEARLKTLKRLDYIEKIVKEGYIKMKTRL